MKKLNLLMMKIQLQWMNCMKQINVTRDASCYLWYKTDVKIDADEGFLKNGQNPTLTGMCMGDLDNRKLSFSNNVNLTVGLNKISLLSVANVGLHFETWNTVVLGQSH